MKLFLLKYWIRFDISLWCRLRKAKVRSLSGKLSFKPFSCAPFLKILRSVKSKVNPRDTTIFRYLTNCSSSFVEIIGGLPASSKTSACSCDVSFKTLRHLSFWLRYFLRNYYKERNFLLFLYMAKCFYSCASLSYSIVKNKSVI